MGGFLGSTVVSTASVGVPPTESATRPQSTSNFEMHDRVRLFFLVSPLNL
jgi:hypothetical protein